MTAWQRLGLEPTDNQREIKKAYAKQLKLIDQDQQPDDFIALRAAFEQAQYEAERMSYEYDDSDDYFFENEKRMKITKASFKNGSFIIERVIPEGKNEMDYKAN